MRWSIPTRVVLWQLGTGVAGSIGWLALGGIRAGLAALAGGAIAAASSLYLALRLGTQQQAAGAGRALGSFLWGWIVKVVVAVALLYAAARVVPDELPALLSTFCVALMVYPFALRWSD